MKKIIALVVAIVMMAAMAVPAFAAFKDDKATTTVKYGVNETYVVVVPSEITMNKEQDSNAASGSNTITISAGYKIPAGKSVWVSVDSDNYADGWYMDNTDSTGSADNLGYTLKAGETDIVAETPFMEAKAGVTTDAVVVTLNCATLGTDQAGTYEDVLTFSANVDTSSN